MYADEISILTAAVQFLSAVYIDGPFEFDDIVVICHVGF